MMAKDLDCEKIAHVPLQIHWLKCLWECLYIYVNMIEISQTIRSLQVWIKCSWTHFKCTEKLPNELEIQKKEKNVCNLSGGGEWDRGITWIQLQTGLDWNSITIES